jgi:hypothetical protein
MPMSGRLQRAAAALTRLRGGETEGGGLTAGPAQPRCTLAPRASTVGDVGTRLKQETAYLVVVWHACYVRAV